MTALLPHQQRVIDEKADLDAKLNGLKAFIGGAVWKTLPEEDKALLEHQAHHMEIYSNILGSRIARFN